MDLRQIFFQDLGESTCSLQSALKSNAPGLQSGLLKCIKKYANHLSDYDVKTLSRSF